MEQPKLIALALSLPLMLVLALTPPKPASTTSNPDAPPLLRLVAGAVETYYPNPNVDPVLILNPTQTLRQTPTQGGSWLEQLKLIALNLSLTLALALNTSQTLRETATQGSSSLEQLKLIALTPTLTLTVTPTQARG